MNKRLVFTGLAVLWTMCAAAQSVDTLSRIGDVNTGPLTMRRAATGEEMVFEVAGFAITLGQSSDDKTKTPKGRRVSGLIFDGIEMGFNTLTGADYGSYPDGTADFMEIRGGNSFHFGVTPIGIQVGLDRKRKFNFSTGLRYTVDNYRLANNAITLGREEGLIVPVSLDEKAAKSKLRITSLGIPLQFSFDPVHRLRIAVIGYCDFTLGANAIYKKPKQKNSLSGVNSLQFGIGGSVSYRGFGVYLRYGVTPLFKDTAGPRCHPLSFGVCIFM